MAPRTRPDRKNSSGNRQGSALGLGRWILLGLGTMIVMVVIGFIVARNPSESFEWIRGKTPEPELSILPSPAFAYHQLRASGALVNKAGRAPSNGIGVQRVVWSVNGEDVGEGPLLAPDHFGRGDLVQVRVEEIQTRDHAKTLATASATITNSPPRILSARIERNPSRPQQVIANVEANDPDGDLLDYQLNWKVDGQAWGAAQGKLADITRLERGQTITFEVVVDDGEDQARTTAQPYSVDNQPPTLDVAAAPILEDTSGGGRRAVLGATSHDPDGDRVVVEAVNAPDGVRFDTQRGALVWSVLDGSQAFDVILRASDDRGGSAERTVTLRR